MVAPSVRIVHLDLDVLEALAAGDLEAANAVSPVALSAFFVGPQSIGTWRRRAIQVRDDPHAAAWVTGLVVDAETGVAVGRAGYHGPPDDDGMVEVGYTIDEPFRRRGYARAVLEVLLARARREPGVTTFRATVSPTNEPSLGLVRQFPFVEVGEQWDEEDGLEIIFEIPLGELSPSCEWE